MQAEDFVPFLPRKYGIILAGSFAELPLLYSLSNITDIDMMMEDKKVIAVENGETSQGSHKKEYGKIIIGIDATACHICFARLWRANGIPYYRRRIRSKNAEFYVGPSLRKCLKQSVLRKTYLPMGFIRKLEDFSIDNVYAVRCMNWPSVASEWIQRKRHCWPSRSIIDEVARKGCHLVPKPHQSHPNDVFEWRYSFSEAEVLLIHSWSTTQKLVYHVLRLMKRAMSAEIGDSILQSYFIKTCMFWKCEEEPVEFWDERNLPEIITNLLETLIDWLILRKVRNYFIPANNMLDHVAENSSYCREIDFLFHCIETKAVEFHLDKVWKLTTDGETWNDFGNFNPDQKLKWYNLFAYVTQYLTKTPLKDKEVSFSNFAQRLKGTRSLIDGLCLMLSASTEDELSTIEKCLLEGVAEGGEIPSYSSLSFLDSSPCQLIEYLVQQFERDTSDMMMTCGGCDGDDKPQSHHHSSLADVLLTEFTTLNTVFRDTFPLSRSRCCILWNVIYPQIFRILPPILYFLQVAYLANFYYVTKQDFYTVIRLCDKVCDVRQLKINIRMCGADVSDGQVPFLLRNKLSVIYDKHIQTVLGLLVLFKFTLRFNDSSIAVAGCPVLFILYLRLQSLRKSGMGVQGDVRDFTNHGYQQNQLGCRFVKLKLFQRILILANVISANSTRT